MDPNQNTSQTPPQPPAPPKIPAPPQIPPEIAALETQKVRPVSPSAPIPTWVVIGSLFIFQPLGLFFVFKYKRYHSWVPNLILMFGISALFVYLAMMFSVLPQVTKLAQSVNSKSFNASSVYFIGVVFLILSITQTISWFFLRREVKQYGELSPLLIWISVALIIIVEGIGPVYVVNSMIAPIYSIVGQLQ